MKNGGRICKRLRLLGGGDVSVPLTGLSANGCLVGGGDVSVPLIGPSPVAMSDVRFSCDSLEDQTCVLVISV